MRPSTPLNESRDSAWSSLVPAISGQPQRALPHRFAADRAAVIRRYGKMRSSLLRVQNLLVCKWPPVDSPDTQWGLDNAFCCWTGFRTRRGQKAGCGHANPRWGHAGLLRFLDNGHEYWVLWAQFHGFPLELKKPPVDVSRNPAFRVALYLQSKPGTLCLAPTASRPDGTVLIERY